MPGGTRNSSPEGTWWAENRLIMCRLAITTAVAVRSLWENTKKKQKKSCRAGFSSVVRSFCSVCSYPTLQSEVGDAVGGGHRPKRGDRTLRREVGCPDPHHLDDAHEQARADGPRHGLDR